MPQPPPYEELPGPPSYEVCPNCGAPLVDLTRRGSYGNRLPGRRLSCPDSPWLVGLPYSQEGTHTRGGRQRALWSKTRSEAERRGRGRLSGPVTGGSLPATPWVPRRFIGGQEHLHRDGSSGERLAGLPVGLLPGQEEVWLSLLCSVHPQPTKSTLRRSLPLPAYGSPMRPRGPTSVRRPSRSCPVGSPRTAP